MTNPVQSSNPSNSVQSTPTAAAGTTSVEDLMIWLKGRTHQMWNDISAATKGVNDRQGALDALSKLPAAKSNQEGYDLCNEAMSHLPEGSPEWNNVKQQRDMWQGRITAVTTAEAQGKSEADVVAQVGTFDQAKAQSKDAVDQIKSDVNQENQQTTVLLQKTMNEAQEAFGEVSAIFKGRHDTEMDAIHKI